MASLLATGLLVLSACQGGSLNQSEVETALRAIAHEGRSPSDVSVIYDDMHGLWGGVTITVSGAGTYEQRQRDRGAGSPQVVTGSIGTLEIRELADLLLELRAWEQATPERTPVPDESRATLTLRIGDTRVTVWEWYNDLTKNGRLVRVRDRMLEIGRGTRPGEASS